MKHYCSCGKQKPYRRAFQCTICWLANTQKLLILAMGRSQGKGTLRAGNIAKIG